MTGRSGFFRRYAPRALAAALEDTAHVRLRGVQRDSRSASPSLGLGEAAELADDLRDAGLAALEDAQLLELARDHARPVAQALYRVSVFDRSTRIIDSAVERIVEVLRNRARVHHRIAQPMDMRGR